MNMSAIRCAPTKMIGRQPFRRFKSHGFAVLVKQTV
jgi:hypothetical protein